jgi:hypothetical protein
MTTPIALSITGSLHEPDDDNPQIITRYVYQRTSKMFGNLPTHHPWGLQRKRYKKPRDTVTPALAARRELFRQAVAGWTNTTDTEKDHWRAVGAADNIPGRNAYIRAFMRTNQTPPQGWDNGQTIWDGGATIWDVPDGTAWDGGASAWDDGATIWDVANGTAWDGGATTWDSGATNWTT